MGLPHPEDENMEFLKRSDGPVDLFNAMIGAEHIPDPDRKPEDLLALLEWATTNCKVGMIRFGWSQRFLADVFEPSGVISFYREADTLTESLLKALDAALLSRKEEGPDA